MKPVVIVGAGLAGSTLAWQLHFQGVPFVLIDRNDPAASSPIAAGLITPVTGQRMAISWRFDSLWPVAKAFYQRIEVERNVSLLRITPAVRIFKSDLERLAFEQRHEMLSPYLTTIDPPLDSSLAAPFGSFAMAPSAILDVPALLALTRRSFPFIHSADNPLTEFPDAMIVHCLGYAGRNDPHFPGIVFNPTKGEILTLEIPGLLESRTIHAHCWLARMADGTYRAGSTNVRDDLTAKTTASGRDLIESNLQKTLNLPYRVVDHRAAVRPIIRESRPVLGFHPQNPRLACFNGLGAKGSLIAPFYAGQLAAAIAGNGAIDADVDVARMSGAP